MTTGIAKRRIEETPVAVIDFETTGLTPGYDRVVEVSVVRVDPGERPKLVYDTLVNPARPMAATEIHGISDADVARIQGSRTLPVKFWQRQKAVQSRPITCTLTSSS